MQNRKRINLLKIAILSFILILIVTIVGCSSEQPKGGSGNSDRVKPIELKLATFFSTTHPITTDILETWAKMVEDETNGQLKITLYAGETLLKAGDLYEGVVSGITDIGHNPTNYNIARFPVMSTLELAGIEWRSGKAASYAVRDFVEELKDELAEFEDTKTLLVYGLGPGHLFTKKPVKSLEDLKGVEVRVTGGLVNALEALGAVPVAMPMPDTYDALSKGVVQANMAPLEVLETWKHCEVTDYVTLTPFLYNASHYIVMNWDVWNSLSKDIQDAIERVSVKVFEEEACNVFDNTNASGLEYAIEKTGQEIIELSEEETARWMELLEPLHEQYVKELNSKGLPGEKILEKAKELSHKYNEMFD